METLILEKAFHTIKTILVLSVVINVFILGFIMYRRGGKINGHPNPRKDA